MTEGCGLETWRATQYYFASAEMFDLSDRKKVAPRLESVIERLDSRFNEQVSAAIRAAGPPVPNHLHHFFAQHLKLHGRHVTLNFDEGIEQCCDQIGAPRPIPLHGTLNGHGDLALRTRTRELTPDFPTAVREPTETALQSCACLIFVGYSGRDYFDVDPFLRRFVAETDVAGLRVIWIKHHPDRRADRSVDWRHAPALDGRPILMSFHDAGAEVIYRQAHTRTFLDRLARAWGLPTSREPPEERPGPDWVAVLRSHLMLPKSRRRLAIADHWDGMGVAPPVLRLAEELAVTERHLEADAIAGHRHRALSSVGLYRQANRIARRVEEPVRYLTTAAARERIRGAYLRSLWLHVRAVRGLARHSSDTAGAVDLRGDIEIEYLYWYYGARLSRVGSLVGATRRALCRLARLLPAPARSLAAVYDPLGRFERVATDEPYIRRHPHSVHQLVRLHDEVPELAERSLPPAVAVRYAGGRGAYVETDHFGGYTNRHRAEILERLHAKEAVLPEDVLALSERSLLLEDRPGLLKAHLIMRRLGLRTQFPRTAWIEVEWTLAWKLGYLLRWVLRRPRG